MIIRFSHRSFRSISSQIFSAVTFISHSLGPDAIPCLRPYFRISTSTFERILSVKLVIKSVRWLCNTFFSKVKAWRLLLCHFLILFIWFSMWMLIKYLISCIFNNVVELVKLDNFIVRLLFRYFLSCNFLFITSDNKRR